LVPELSPQYTVEVTTPPGSVVDVFLPNASYWFVVVCPFKSTLDKATPSTGSHVLVVPCPKALVLDTGNRW
jgi:hypothetical protein